MPKSKSAKSIMTKMKEKYGEEEGEKIFYAIANKQGRDPDTYKKESLTLVDNVIAESNGVMIIIPAGSMVRDQREVYVEQFLKNGVMVDVDGDCLVCSDCEHNAALYPDLIGEDITDIMDMAMAIASQIGVATNVAPVTETVGTGAIAIVPAALNTKDDKTSKDDDDEEIDEASNSQISSLQ